MFVAPHLRALGRHSPIHRTVLLPDPSERAAYIRALEAFRLVVHNHVALVTWEERGAALQLRLPRDLCNATVLEGQLDGSEVFRQTLLGLEALHHAGVHHGDVSLDALWVDARGHVVLGEPCPDRSGGPEDDLRALAELAEQLWALGRPPAWVDEVLRVVGLYPNPRITTLVAMIPLS